jgi:hypothetical protein
MAAARLRPNRMSNRTVSLLVFALLFGVATPAFADAGCGSIWQSPGCFFLFWMFWIPAYVGGLLLNAFAFHGPFKRHVLYPLPAIAIWSLCLLVLTPLGFYAAMALTETVSITFYTLFAMLVQFAAANAVIALVSYRARLRTA